MSNDFNKIKYELETDGFSCILPNSRTIEFADELSLRFNSRFVLEQSKKYAPTRYNKRNLNQEENLDLREFDNYCQNLISKISKTLFRFDSIFQTYDVPTSRHIAQDPHFDRIPTLKFMLYINDLDFENGAFCLSPGSHHWVKKCLGNTRQAHGAKGFLELSRDIPDFIKDRLISVESKMGTIIIFDTDCIHHQGICQFGQASIIRAHYREVRHRFLTKMVKTLDYFNI